jgi:hypothetical protein
MAKDINKDIAFTGQCVAAVLVTAWRHGFVAASPGPPPGGVGSLAAHLGVPEAVLVKWLPSRDSVILASLIHLLEYTLEDLREHDVAVPLPVGMPTTTSTEKIPMERAIATRYRHRLLYATLGLANKFSVAGAARELQDAFVDLWVRVEMFEREARERGYRSRGLEMVLRRMGPVASSYAARPPVSVERGPISECSISLSNARLNKILRPNYSEPTGVPYGYPRSCKYRATTSNIRATN